MDLLNRFLKEKAGAEAALGVAGILLIVSWIGWSIYSASDRGANAGLGVLVSWPALIAMALIVLSPFVLIGILLMRVMRPGEETKDEAEDEEDDDEEKDDEDEETDEDEDGEEDEDDDNDEEEDEDDEDEEDDGDEDEDEKDD